LKDVNKVVQNMEQKEVNKKIKILISIERRNQYAS